MRIYLVFAKVAPTMDQLGDDICEADGKALKY
jgi:hypothetical protein